MSCQIGSLQAFFGEPKGLVAVQVILMFTGGIDLQSVSFMIHFLYGR